MTDSVDCVVAGAGVVGLAVARELAIGGLETLVLEREHQIGTGTSSRNSEVIHAGIYYPPGSLKADFCVRGKQMLYAFCESHGIEYRRCGKLIVATSESQVRQLEQIRANAEKNGVTDLELLDQRAALALEASLSCDAALHSPSTGIIDSHACMLALQGDLEQTGGMIAFGSRIQGGEVAGAGIDLEIEGDEEMKLNTRYLINCAGLDAQALALAISGINTASVPPLYLARGNYYTLDVRNPFTRLIYPVPEDGGLGVHLTLDLGGRARFGPDVEWIEHIDYSVDPSRSRDFYAAIRRYWPELPDNSLSPDYAGIRPKTTGPGQPAGDFVIQDESDHQVPGLVNLFGIESPGLTASLAIAEAVRHRLLN